MANIKEYPELDTELSKRFFDYEYTYQFCMNISFNEEGDPDKDFAIFLHCLDPERPYTDGGVAIPEDMMRRIIHKNVREDCVVIIDTMDNLGATFD